MQFMTFSSVFYRVFIKNKCQNHDQSPLIMWPW